MKATAFKDLTPRKKKKVVEPTMYKLSGHAMDRLKERWPSIFKLGNPRQIISSIINSTRPCKVDDNAACYSYQGYIIVVLLRTNIVKTVKYAYHI